MADTQPNQPLDPTVATPGPTGPTGAPNASGTPGSTPRRRRRNRSGDTPNREPIANMYPAPVGGDAPTSQPIPIRTVDEARALARDRFKDRVQAGEKVGGCDCHSTETVADAISARPNLGPAARVAGVRFRDSGRLYYFDAGQFELEPGDWVVVDTERGQEAGRVIVAPQHMLLNQLQGDLRSVQRTLGDDDIALMDRLKRESSAAVRTFSDLIREHRVPIKPISATFSFDGSLLTLSYAPHQGVERPDLRSLGRDLVGAFGCRVDLKAVSPREEARLLGGLGRCGRTLCCSSWLPVFPEITMGMAKTQDLALNPSKVSGVCGRLLCCLSYENEQYKQLKSVLPRLGQRVETADGWGQVVSLQVLKEQVVVRMEQSGEQVTLASSELGPRSETVAPASVVIASAEPLTASATPVAPPEPAGGTDEAGAISDEETRRRRRRRRNHGPGDASV